MSAWVRAAAGIAYRHRVTLSGLSASGIYETVCACGERWTATIKGEDERQWARHLAVRWEAEMPVGSGRGVRYVA